MPGAQPDPRRCPGAGIAPRLLPLTPARRPGAEPGAAGASQGKAPAGREGGKEKGEPSPPSAQDASGMEAAGGPRESATLTGSSSQGDGALSLLREREGFPPPSGAGCKRDRTARTRPATVGSPLPEHWE